MEYSELQNGLKVFFQKRDDLRSATVGVWVAAGSANETTENNGVSHFIEHIVFKGTATRSAKELAQAMDEIGAQVNAYTTKEYTFFYVRALEHHILEGADLLFDMICNPAIGEEELKAERGVILEEIAMCEDDPGDVCYERNESARFADSPLSLEILGTRESVKRLQKDDLERFRARFYAPQRMVVGVGGRFDETAMRKLIETYFAPLKPTDEPLCAAKGAYCQGITRLRKTTAQTHLILSFPGAPLFHEDQYPLQVLMFLLGTGSSSRLNQRIREELGLVYGIDAWLGRFLSCGYIAVSMSLAGEAQETALKETCRIIYTLSETLTEKELRTAKEKLTSSLIMHREQPHSKLSSLGHDLLFRGCFTDDDEIIEKIRAVTLERLCRCAKDYLDLDRASCTVVGKTRAASFYETIIRGSKPGTETKRK